MVRPAKQITLVSSVPEEEKFVVSEDVARYVRDRALIFFCSRSSTSRSKIVDLASFFRDDHVLRVRSS